MIIEGIAPNQNKSFALELFNEASIHNDSRALNGLGYMHLNGIATPKNMILAQQYFRSIY